MVLVEPSPERVNQFNKWWRDGTPNPDSIWIRLYADEDIFVTAKDAKVDFGAIRRGEDLLDSVFGGLSENKSMQTETAVLLLDSIYHTQMKDPLGVAEKLHKKVKQGLLDRIHQANNAESAARCVDEIAVIGKEVSASFIYSFATKFCNRINNKAFPIFDSYVAYLLYTYLRQDEKMKEQRITQKSLGDYRAFIKAYDVLREKCLGGWEFNYKKIDIFMWTYGKALNSKENPRLKSKENPEGTQHKFDSIPYDNSWQVHGE